MQIESVKNLFINTYSHFLRCATNFVNTFNKLRASNKIEKN